jgi:cytosine/adenosine deaminase-related metal-dependent hydrolase
MDRRSRHQASWLKAAFVVAALFAFECRDPKPFPTAAEEPEPAGSAGGTAVEGFGGGSAGESATGAGAGGSGGDGAAGRGRAGSDAAGSAGRETNGGRGGQAATSGDGGEAGGDDAMPVAAPRAFETVTCGVLEGDACTFDGAGDELVVTADLVTSGTVYLAGQLRVRADGTLGCVGCDCSSQGPARALRCPHSVVGPAFVNPHDHVAYAHQAPRPAVAERYDHRHDWRLGVRGHAAIPYEGGAPAAARAAHELRMLLGGATTIAGGAGHRGLLRNPDVPGMEEGLPTAPANSDTFPLDDTDGLFVTDGCRYGTGHTTSDSVERFGAYLPHLAEGVDRAATNELRCALGKTFGLVQASSAVVHAVSPRAEDAADLAERGAIVVWSPRSNLSLYGNTAPIAMLRQLGVEVALGTDWLLSGSMNVQRELACAREFSETYLDGALDDAALFGMVTATAARAVGAERALGALRVGYLADLVMVRRRGLEPHAELVGATAPDVELVLRGGTATYGRAELVEGLGRTDCEPLDVCGAAQRVCVGETGLTLAAIRAAGEAAYPLFSCEIPPNEPSCVPSRPGEYDGVPTDGDRDGDGILDAEDACPRVFDPLRPTDEGRQPDADGDGWGDACDPCPFDVNVKCSAPPAFDADRDGIADGRDLCPRNADAAARKLDTDEDGVGDACDFCAAPNPGVTPCPLAISALRDPEDPNHPPRHARVAVSGSVTALRPDTGGARGYYVQQGVEPFSGLFVYTGGVSPGVATGDVVTLLGRYDVYYGADQLVAPVVALRTPGPSLEPLLVAANTIGDSGALGRAYDSMLVRVESVSVARTNPDAPSDYDETELQGALRIDDLLCPDLDNAYAAGTPFRGITGISGHSFDHQKLWPRSLAELEP